MSAPTVTELTSERNRLAAEVARQDGVVERTFARLDAMNHALVQKYQALVKLRQRHADQRNRLTLAKAELDTRQAALDQIDADLRAAIEAEAVALFGPCVGVV